MNLIETKLAEIKAKAMAAAEASRLTALENEGTQQAIMRKVIAEETISKLNQLHQICESIVTSMPIYNTATKENRKWKPTRTYGFGDQIALLTGLLTGIQYAANEHKADMLLGTNLTSTLVESTLNSLGSLTYYSPRYETIVLGVPMNVDEFKQNIELINIMLGLDINTSSITEAAAQQREALAKVKAEKDKQEHELTKALEATTFA